VKLLGTLPRTEKTPLDLSIAKAQKGPWVFEVKHFKYTLFTLILAQREYHVGTAAFGCPGFDQSLGGMQASA
jgi:hypothetical protein